MNTITPRPMPTPDLAGLLAKPPRPTTPQPVLADRPEQDQTAANPAPVPTPQSAGARQAKTARLPKPESPEPTAKRQYLRSIAVYLPRSVHQHLAQRSDTTGTTRTALILTAVNATHEHLGAALGKDRPDSGGVDDLFEIPQRRAPSELNVQTSIRVTDHQLQVIDTLAARHETNRSKLLTTALKLYLDA